MSLLLFSSPLRKAHELRNHARALAFAIEPSERSNKQCSSRNKAEQAYREVLGSGVPENHVRMTDQQRTPPSDSEGGGIWDWLFGSEVPEGDRRHYNDRMANGGTVLSVLVDSPSIANVQQVMKGCWRGTIR